jgi:DNA methylase
LSHQAFLLPSTCLRGEAGLNKFKRLANRPGASKQPFLARCDNAPAAIQVKKGTAPHVNNVELGKRGRWRSNVWTYPGASSLGSDARRGLKDHPTVKPTAMLEDALLDLTNRSDIVIDQFLGSGSTLIAADKIRGRDRQPGSSRRDRGEIGRTGRA